jgi:hypothetical protein
MASQKFKGPHHRYRDGAIHCFAEHFFFPFLNDVNSLYRLMRNVKHQRISFTLNWQRNFLRCTQCCASHFGAEGGAKGVCLVQQELPVDKNHTITWVQGVLIKYPYSP